MGTKLFPWKEVPDFDSCQFQDRGGDIDRAHQTTTRAARLDLLWPARNPRGFDSTVVQSCFGARKRPAIVTDEQHEGIIAFSLSIEFCQNLPDVMIESRNLVVVQSQVLTGFRHVRQVGRYHHIFGTMRIRENTFFVVAVRIERREP